MKSFFEKLTGAVDLEDGIDESVEEVEENKHLDVSHQNGEPKEINNGTDWIEEENEEGELTIDMFQEPDKIVIKTMVAGVKPEDLDISITRDMVTIRGKREESRIISEDDYFAKELYWGSFSRTITLPSEIDIEESKATEKQGLLTIELPKIDKGRETKLKVKTH